MLKYVMSICRTIYMFCVAGLTALIRPISKNEYIKLKNPKEKYEFAIIYAYNKPIINKLNNEVE